MKMNFAEQGETAMNPEGANSRNKITDVDVDVDVDVPICSKEER